MNRQIGVVILCLILSRITAAQIKGSLRTAETQMQLQADENAPRLVELTNGSVTWKNRISDTLIPNADVVADGNAQNTKIQWRLNRSDSHVDKDVVRVVYDSINPNLRLTWEWQVRSEHGPIEHQIRIENRDTRTVWLPFQNSFQFAWQTSVQEKLEHFCVEKGADTPSEHGTHLIEVSDGYDWEGTSSTYAQPRSGEAREIIPYFLVQRSDGDQSGWYVGIEFSGRTHLTLARKGETLHGEVGLNPKPGPFRTRLEPGEMFEAPRIFLGATAGGPDSTGNVLRRWVREVLTNPDTWKDPHYPFTVNNSWGGGMTVNDEISRRMIRDSAELGLEMFHMDAGWFRGVGDWYPDLNKFPHGLKPIADDAHAHGLKFGLWADWAQAGVSAEPGALNIHNLQIKNWLTTDLPATWTPEEFKGQTIDIGVPTVKAWAMGETERLVTDYKLDMLEHDGYLVAKGCDAPDHPHAPPDLLNRCTYRDSGFVFTESSNSTDVSYHAVHAYYDIQSTLRNRHPGLLLEICNDGGRMVDFGSAAHGDYFSITDTYDPLSNRRAFYDASFVLPAAMLEAYVERWITPTIENFKYMLRSGMMGWMTIMLDTSVWDQHRHAVAKQEFDLYKNQLRLLIRDANLYHISERPDGVHWDGIEYFDPRTRRGVVYAFRGSIENEKKHRFWLHGLRPDSRYQMRFQDHSSPDQVKSGASLIKRGLVVGLATKNSSEIILFDELPATIR